MQQIINDLIAVIADAGKQRIPLQIRGGGSKHFYGNTWSRPDALLDIRPYHGIVAYEPTELVVTARAGTQLTDLQALLDQHGQMLAFEPPLFAASATLGGCVAAGLSGPRRAAAGAVRDFVLGVRLLNGRGDDLHFGGQVMKNVAGYDVSRLMVGSLGTLGVLLEVSLKVLPKPQTELTLGFSMDAESAINVMNQWAGKPLPISATCFADGVLKVRLSGAQSAVKAARSKLGGDMLGDDAAFWESIREHTHAFFQSGKMVWRLSVKSTTVPMILPGRQLIEWNGALRWLACEIDEDPAGIRKAAKAAGGHATLFRGNTLTMPVFHPLDDGVMHIHRALKEKFDPAGILNPGRLYPEF
ncbi:MAG: glycolate oxidase subunit GlcE [Nitrosomonas sp.]|nr:MAG: glycolate oxidase subunit GlcE [Nitrosomonas sp.]